MGRLGRRCLDRRVRGRQERIDIHGGCLQCFPALVYRERRCDTSEVVRATAIAIATALGDAETGAGRGAISFRRNWCRDCEVSRSW
jgi:hypothetical protein